jgi:ubiquinone biosynthesis protein
MPLNWDLLLDEATLASVLPADSARFARPIRDALTVFLSGLPAAQQRSILLVQAGLPVTAPFSQRLGLLARGSAVLHKLGQILARDQRLPAELRCHLRELESLPPSVPLPTIRQTLDEELGSLDRLGITLQPAIAEASVAVVLPFQQTSPGGQLLAQGVFKVLKPHIEQQLRCELELLDRVGEHLDNRCQELGIPHLDYQEAFQQARDKLLDEVQLENEQRHLVQAKRFFADEPQVRIPGLLEHCTSRVTAMERISGDKVTSHALHHPREKRRLARLIARALIAKPVFSTAEQPMFHGDPHAGNLFLTEDGCLGILDWSLTGTLGVNQRIAIVQLLLAAVTLDPPRIVAILGQLADRQRIDDQQVQAVAEDWVRRVRRGQFPGLSWLVGLLDDAVHRARLRVSADMMLFRKTLLTLEGVVADVGQSGGQIDSALSSEFLRNFAAEWPARWLQAPDSRQLATRLSNLDVSHTLLSYPATMTRFWTGHTFDILQACVNHWQQRLRPSLALVGDAMSTARRFQKDFSRE